MINGLKHCYLTTKNNNVLRAIDRFFTGYLPVTIGRVVIRFAPAYLAFGLMLINPMQTVQLELLVLFVTPTVRLRQQLL